MSPALIEPPRPRPPEDQDAVGGFFVFVIGFVSESAADLRLADATIAKDDQLDIDDGCLTRLEVLEVRANRGEAIVAVALRQCLCGHTGDPGVEQRQSLQRREVTDCFGQGAENAIRAVESSQRGEARQWCQVAHLRAAAIERLQRGEARQRRQVANLREAAIHTSS